MKLTEIFSDESNFRSYIVSNFVRFYKLKIYFIIIFHIHFFKIDLIWNMQTEVLSRVFLLAHGKFLSNWCSYNSEPLEEDITLNYDSFSASRHVWVWCHVQNFFQYPSCFWDPLSISKNSSLLVKFVANLTCFVPL